MDLLSLVLDVDIATASPTASPVYVRTILIVELASCCALGWGRGVPEPEGQVAHRAGWVGPSRVPPRRANISHTRQPSSPPAYVCGVREERGWVEEVRAVPGPRFLRHCLPAHKLEAGAQAQVSSPDGVAFPRCYMLCCWICASISVCRCPCAPVCLCLGVSLYLGASTSLRRCAAVPLCLTISRSLRLNTGVVVCDVAHL